MTEEQFWHSNPRIIKIWEEAFKLKMNNKNKFIYEWVGSYGISALRMAIDNCLNGRKAKAKYLDEPIQLFELTEKEKKAAAIKAREQFVAWAKHAEKKYSKKGE